jgi:hypothetical protein
MCVPSSDRDSLDVRYGRKATLTPTPESILKGHENSPRPRPVSRRRDAGRGC